MKRIVDLFRQERGSRVFFAALGCGALGNGASYVGVLLVAYERLGSAWAASVVLLADVLPGMLLGPVVGAWLDRGDRLRSAMVSDVVRAAALAAMVLAPGAGSLVALALVMGVAGTVFRPAAFGLLPAAVAEERRMAATALWGAMYDAGLLVGPALGAGLLVLGGTDALLGGTAALFAGSAVLLARTKLASVPEQDSNDEASLVAGAREGLRFVARDRVLRVLISGTGVIVLTCGMMNVAEVLLAERELNVGGAGFAAMVAVFGVGAVLGSLASARSETLAELKRGYLAGLVILAAGLLGSSLAPNLGVALVSFFITGVGSSASMTHDRGMLQHLVPGHMLSRAHALVGTLESWGFAGAALLGGTLATVLGARGVFAVSGSALLIVSAAAAAALFASQRQERGTHASLPLLREETTMPRARV
jgi:MFS family permease